MATEDN